MNFRTVDVLSVSTGKLLGDIDGVYQVMSYLVGRDVATHEIPIYRRQAAAAIRAAVDGLPDEAAACHVDGEDFVAFTDQYVSMIGLEIDLPDSLRDCLADDRTAIDTLQDLDLAPG